MAANFTYVRVLFNPTLIWLCADFNLFQRFPTYFMPHAIEKKSLQIRRSTKLRTNNTFRGWDLVRGVDKKNVEKYLKIGPIGCNRHKKFGIFLIKKFLFFRH